MTSAASLAQAAQTLTRDPWTLPAAWFEDGAAERMSEWIRRQKEAQR